MSATPSPAEPTAEDVRKQLSQSVQRSSKFSASGMLERIFARVFTGLVYPQIWEDPIVDMEALQIKPTDHLVAIASGGCNVMSYLICQPASINAVDLSPAHIALNRLKYAAATHLPDHGSFFQLFGQADVSGNAALFDSALKPHVDATTASWWSARKGLSGRRIDMFEQGLYRFGALGQFIAWAHRIARWHGVDFAQFMQCKTMDEQRAFFEKEVKPALNGAMVRFLASNRMSLFGLGIPPQQYEALAGAADGDIHAVLVERTRALMCDFALSENYFAWAAFNRGYDKHGNGPLPPYLQEQNWEVVRANAHKINIHNRTITAYLADQPAASKDCFVLLDAQDWMTDDQLNALWNQIMRTAKPGARVIYRTAGIDCILPGRVEDAVMKNWDYDKQASQTGLKNDRSAIYGGFHLYRLRG